MRKQRISQAVPMNDFTGHANTAFLMGTFEVPARPRNQKIGSPGGFPQFSDLPGALRPG